MIIKTRKYLSGIATLKKQIIKFTLIGSLAVLVDYICYISLLYSLPKNMFFIGNEPLAKAASFIVGMLVTYTLNKYWTWKQRNRSNRRLLKFIMLYGSSLFINVGVNSLLIYILFSLPLFENLPYPYTIAFLGATVVSSLVNFTGQKFWVFKVQPDRSFSQQQIQ